MSSPDLSPQDLVAVSDAAVDPSQLLSFVEDPSCGAVVLFLGTVRDHSPGGITDVSHLEYEAYGGVVEAKIAEIVGEARGKWPVVKVAAVHRTGELGIGETSVGVAVSSAHRTDAFAAGRYLIDELKARAPIWKKEHWPGGAQWVREDVVRSNQDSIE